jgi:aminoglycoside phosphotransferase (APT) family kinase protein
MSMGEIDISWQALRRIVQDWAGTSAELKEFIPLHGGHINTTLDLHLTDGRRLVIKVSPHRVDKSYEREAYQLTLLKNCGIPVPEVYTWKIGSLDDPFSYILLEFVKGVDFGEARKQCTIDEFDVLQAEFAEIVATMHANTNAKYMRVTEGCTAFDAWHGLRRVAGVLPVRLRRDLA